MKKTIVVGTITASLALVPAVATAAAPSNDKCFGKAATIIGTNASETLWGTGGQDVIKAYGGDDTIYGLGGNDLICAGSGDDKVFAGKGNDKVWGAGGDDVAFGGDGNDLMFGVWGNDTFFGGAGTDTSREGARWGETAGVEVPRTTKQNVPMVLAAGLRVKGANSGREIYIGVPDLGNGANRNEYEYEGLENGGGTAPIELSWVPGKDALMAVVDGVEAVYQFASEMSPNCAVEDWDAMQILVRENGSGATFENAKFNGNGLFPANGDVFDPAIGYPAWPNGPRAMSVTDLDFDSAWTITGDLVATADFDGNEGDALQILVGCKTHPDRVLGS